MARSGLVKHADRVEASDNVAERDVFEQVSLHRRSQCFDRTKKLVMKATYRSLAIQKTTESVASIQQQPELEGRCRMS